MKWQSGKTQTAGSRPPGGYGINSHSWATKMEIQRSFSGKADLEIEAAFKTAVRHPDQTAAAQR